MIISHELKFVYLGIPRTANRATHQMLLELPGAQRIGLLHHMDVPSECRSYFTFCCVRNPYRRTLAYYRWRNIPHPWQDAATNMSFKDYVDASIEGAMGPTTVGDFTDGIRLDCTYRYEDLPGSLQRLESSIRGIGSLTLPTIAGRLSRHWKYYYDQETADQVYEMTKSDFDRYGYDRESWRF